MIYEQTVLHKNHKEKLPLSAVVPFLKKIYNRFTREIIVNEFKASVIPTIENIQRILKDHELVASKDFVLVNQALKVITGQPKQFNMYHNSNAPLTNTNLMANFPGIHFNFTCRNVEEECEGKTATRREESTEAATAIQTQLAKKENVLGDDFDYVLERVEEILERDYNSLHTKRVALYNSLLSIKTVVQKLNPKEQQEVVNYLVKDKEKILQETPAQRSLIEKKIVALITQTPLASLGGKRSSHSGKRSKTRKQKRLQKKRNTRKQ